MNGIFNDNDRYVIPRWRTFKETARLGELSSLRSHSIKDESDDQHFRKKVADWQNNRNILFAADLIASAYVLRQYEPAYEAALYILSSQEESSEFIKNVARRIILQDKEEEGCESSISIIDHMQKSREQVRYLKEILRNDPFNVIAYIDIAREYSSLGQNIKAKESIEFALKLAPTNRFVLRAACRLFHHLHEPGHAQYLLKNSPLIKNDPWILSAEIATSAVTGQISANIRRGRELSTSRNFHPAQLTELTSALGTLEYIAGDNRASKKMFEMSLLDPNDNSFAQAVWVSKKISSLEAETEKLQGDIPCSFEASARKLFSAQDWSGALGEAKYWLIDQPFSKHPAILGSFLASSTLFDYKQSADIALFGLQANPDEPTLLNNLAFSLANLNMVENAEKCFEKIKFEDIDLQTKIVWTATKGLIAFRKGQIEEGQNNYRKAMILASSDTNEYYYDAASIYLAREELIASVSGAIENADGLIRKLEEKKDPIIKLQIKNLEKILSKKR